MKNQEKNKFYLCKMNFSTLWAVFFEKRIPQNLAFVKTWQDMENAKAQPLSPKTDKKRRKCSGRAQKKAAKTRRTPCGTVENMLYYLS